MSNKYEISLGVNVDVSDIQEQLNRKTNGTSIPVYAEIENLDEIKKQIQGLGKDGKSSLTFDTEKLEASLNDVKSVIRDVRDSIGNINNKSGMKSLLSSVNQIATALGKAENESNSLIKSLSALSKKDLSLNFKLDMGKKNLSTIGYGRAARKQVIPELESQIKYLENLFGGQQATLNKLTSQGGNVGFDVFTDFGDFNSDSAIKKMEAMEKYINSLKKLATLNNVNLDGFNKQFSKGATELINDITGVENAVDKAEDLSQKLKNIFGGSVDGENLTKQLDEIVVDLGEIKTGIQSLSSGASLGTLTQSFEKLSDTIEKLVSNFTLAKNALGDGLGGAASSVNNTINAAQQTGQKIGDTINKSTQESLNIDDVIDKQVTDLMAKYAIAGKKGSKAFEEIRQAIVEYRKEVKAALNDMPFDIDYLEFGDIANIKQARSAIASHVKVADDGKEAYRDLLEFIKKVNASGAKVHLPDTIKQEYGDDFRSMRSQLGKAFTTGKGQDFESFIVELNGILGETIDLSNGAEAAFADLVNKVNSAKGDKFLSEDELFKNGFLSVNELENDINFVIDNINSEEDKLAQSSIESTNIVVKNEEKKQQAISETANTVKKLSQQSNKPIINIGEFADAGIEETVDHINDLDNALKKVGFNDAARKDIIKDFENLEVTVNKIKTSLSGNTLTVNVDGIDQNKRAVQVMGSFAPDGEGNLTTGSFRTSVTQYFKDTEESFKRLKSLAKEMGNLDLKIINFEADGEIEEANSLKRVLNELGAEYRELYDATQQNLSVDQVKELDQIFANTTNEIREFKNELSETEEAQKLTYDFEKLKSIAKEMASLEIDIFNSNDKNKIIELITLLDKLEKEYNDILVGTNGKLSSSQLNQLDNIAKQGDQALTKLANKIDEVKVKLAKDIKINFEVGKYDDDLSKMYDSFIKLSHVSEGVLNELEQSIIKVENAYKAMELASNPDDNGYIDKEKLIKAEQDYARALETTNNLLRTQAREQKTYDALEKLHDDKQLFQSNIDAWLSKNSAAAERFGNRLREMKEEAQSADRVKLSSLQRELKKIDKEAETAGLKMQSLGDRIKTKAKEYMAYFSVAEVFMYAEQALRDMFEQVKAIDSAMTELKKVTDETDESYNQFLSNAANRAKKIGTTIDGLVASTADFARLGYNFVDSQGLAEVANIYAVVGDEVEGVEGATESLISTMAAFKNEAKGVSNTDFAMSIVDKYNEIGNKFAITSGGIGEALQRSASSLDAANNSMDESIALITAANTVVQNPDKVGRLLPTIKMAISVKLQRWTRPRKDFISIFDIRQLGRTYIFCAF